MASASAESTEAAGEAGAAVVEEEKPLTEAEMAQKAKMEEIERLRAKEKFVTVKTGMVSTACVFKRIFGAVNLSRSGREAHCSLLLAVAHECARPVFAYIQRC